MPLDLRLRTVPERHIIAAATRRGFVYVMLADRFVKVGYANDVQARHKCLQAACPLELVVVGATAGSIPEEKLLHGMLRRWRVHGEWYHAAPELLAVLAGVGIPLDADVLRAAGHSPP